MDATTVTTKLRAGCESVADHDDAIALIASLTADIAGLRAVLALKESRIDNAVRALHGETDDGETDTP